MSLKLMIVAPEAFVANPRLGRWLQFGFAFTSLSVAALAQNSAPTTLPSFTNEHDQQNMMHQLGIRALRPGPSADEHVPNHANYDESKANPYSNIPDALTLKDGQKVKTPQQWQQRRA